MEFGLTLVIGAILSLLGIGVNNGIGYIREKKAREENFEYNEQAAENADERTRALYNDIQSPDALLQQYQEAGLSPSMMFGGSVGGQPVSGAQGQGATGVNPSTFGMDLDASQAADTSLKIAEARKANAEADSIQGINEYGQSEIAKNWAQAGASEAAACLNRAEEVAQNWENYKTQQTITEQISTIKDNALKAFADAQNSDLAWKFNQASFEERLETISQTLANMKAEELETKQNIKLSRAQIKRMAAEIMIQAQEAETHAKNADAYRDYINTMEEYYPEHLKNERWQIGAQAFTDLCKTAAAYAGAANFEGETTGETVTQYYDSKGNPQGKTVITNKGGNKGSRNYTGRRTLGVGGKW